MLFCRNCAMRDLKILCRAGFVFAAALLENVKDQAPRQHKSFSAVLGTRAPNSVRFIDSDHLSPEASPEHEVLTYSHTRQMCGSGIGLARQCVNEPSSSFPGVRLGGW